MGGGGGKDGGGEEGRGRERRGAGGGKWYVGNNKGAGVMSF